MDASSRAGALHCPEIRILGIGWGRWGREARPPPPSAAVRVTHSASISALCSQQLPLGHRASLRFWVRDSCGRDRVRACKGGATPGWGSGWAPEARGAGAVAAVLARCPQQTAALQSRLQPWPRLHPQPTPWHTTLRASVSRSLGSKGVRRAPDWRGGVGLEALLAVPYWHFSPRCFRGGGPAQDVVSALIPEQPRRAEARK